jgi:hypothetical protein
MKNILCQWLRFLARTAIKLKLETKKNPRERSFFSHYPTPYIGRLSSVDNIIHHHPSIHHDQSVRTSLYTFLSIAILTNTAITGAPYRRETAEGHG